MATCFTHENPYRFNDPPGPKQEEGKYFRLIPQQQYTPPEMSSENTEKKNWANGAVVPWDFSLEISPQDNWFPLLQELQLEMQPDQVMHIVFDRTWNIIRQPQGLGGLMFPCSGTLTGPGIFNVEDEEDESDDEEDRVESEETEEKKTLLKMPQVEPPVKMFSLLGKHYPSIVVFGKRNSGMTTATMNILRFSKRQRTKRWRKSFVKNKSL